MTRRPRRDDWMLYAGIAALLILWALLTSAGALPRLLTGLLGVGLILFSLWKRERDRDLPT